MEELVASEATPPACSSSSRHPTMEDFIAEKHLTIEVST
jgi:hypothetical protein